MTYSFKGVDITINFPDGKGCKDCIYVKTQEYNEPCVFCLRNKYHMKRMKDYFETDKYKRKNFL